MFSISAQSYEKDTAHINLLLNKGQDIYLQNPQAAKDLWEEALAICDELTYSEGDVADTNVLIVRSDLYFNLNQVCRSLGKTDLTIEYLIITFHK